MVDWSADVLTDVRESHSPAKRWNARRSPISARPGMLCPLVGRASPARAASIRRTAP
ncbi:hypothetical protein [Saccharopolyspora aridisoli]|uniref:hypothetical protein n=1 Tax=Saccharopolyspora aridisoli TaxID=2530385 RepID=UPI001404F8FA|nr:hypothetical protein [Saccharopolyspora aridisoli]